MVAPRRLIAALLALAGCGQPALSLRSVGERRALSFSNSVGAYTEIPPWSESGPLLLSSSYSFACVSSTPLLTGSVSVDPPDCRLISRPGTVDTNLAQVDPAAVSAPDWARNYDGVYSSHRSGDQLIVIRHGENKNDVVGSFSYQNTINRDVPVATCTSGNLGNGYQDCFDAYNAFVTLAAGTDFDSLVDLGPIVWPSGGYLDATGAKSSQGVMQPGAIVDDGQLYVYYADSSVSGDTDRPYGFKLARAPFGSTAFTCWRQSTGFSEPCLPAGFDPKRIDAFWAAPGPAADALFDDSDDVTPSRFSVARAGGGRYHAVEEEVFPDRTAIALRTSTDLVHWSDRATLSSLTTSGTWDFGIFHYPILISADGRSNTDIDPADFYILGTGDLGADHATIYAVHLSVTLR